MKTTQHTECYITMFFVFFPLSSSGSSHFLTFSFTGRKKLFYILLQVFHWWSNTPLNHVVQEATVVDLPLGWSVLLGFLQGPHHVTCCWSYKGVKVTTPGHPSLQPRLETRGNGWPHAWETYIYLLHRMPFSGDLGESGVTDLKWNKRPFI